jgi:hypothetical protein
MSGLLGHARRAPLAGALGGLLAGLTLWAWDLASLGGLEFAGTTDRDAEARVTDAAGAAILGVEQKLLLLLLASGALFGLLVGAALRGRRMALTAYAASGLTALLAVGGMAARYPQVVADRWWEAGGAFASLQRVLTHTIGPWPFDGAVAVIVLGLAGIALARLAAAVPAPRRRRVAAASVLALGAVAFARTADLGRPPPASSRNVLLVAVDSMRSDRVERPDVMPWVSAWSKGGRLYRAAFVPIARTFPSWVSMLSGREPRETGVRTMFPTADDRRELGETLFSRLGDAGYRTFVVSDFAGDIFPRFAGGFETVDAPRLDVDRLAASAVLYRHLFALPFLRLRLVRDWLDVWQSSPALADPEWLVDRALEQLDREDGRPFAGAVFFSTAHFPYVAPYPHYLRGSEGYEGRFLYRAPAALEGAVPDAVDRAQAVARYDGALFAVDRALERLHDALDRRGLLERTVVVLTADHGEELYEEGEVSGHGDTLGFERSLRVPVMLWSPGLEPGASNAQVRSIDLPATVLELLGLGARDMPFGAGRSLLDETAPRPLCVETGLWFWPDRPPSLEGRRLTYPAISELLTLDEHTRELVLAPEHAVIVETAKARGLVLGDRATWIRPTPDGVATGMESLHGVAPGAAADLEAEFWSRCVDGDPSLERYLGLVVARTPGGAQ